MFVSPGPLSGEEHPLNAVTPATENTAKAVASVRRKVGVRVGEVQKVCMLPYRPS